MTPTKAFGSQCQLPKHPIANMNSTKNTLTNVSAQLLTGNLTKWLGLACYLLTISWLHFATIFNCFPSTL